MENSKQELFLKLRQKHPVFVYSGYDMSESVDALRIIFHYSIPGLTEFHPVWEINKPHSYFVGLEDKTLNNLVFSLGMVEMISYWKTTCSPEIHINCGALSEDQSNWWKKLYKKGLGEFFYTNSIEPGDELVSFICHTANVHRENTAPDNLFEGDVKVLIPIGGGKDSAVTLELLNNYAQRYCYIINPGKAMLDTVKAAEIEDENVITARRTLAGEVLDLNRQGYLNGHTPFSALVAFSSVISAYIHGIEFVALSNEASANEPTVSDTDVNHQYSKSFEFETDFIKYEARYIDSGVKYFSLLRPFTEIGIAKIFSRFVQYHSLFRSCNAGSKEGIWCARCPKCLFVYIILAPFISEHTMTRIFGRNMLYDEGMVPILGQLIGVLPDKPFECVGSRDEVSAALWALLSQYQCRNAPLPVLLDYYKNSSIEKNENFSYLCKSFDENHHIPDIFADAVSSVMA